jgi:uncharacterized membrane protein
MNLKHNLILSFVAVFTTMIWLGYLNADNKRLRSENIQKSKIIDSLRLELTNKEFEYEKFDILMDVLDSTTKLKIDSALQNIE